MPPSQMWHSGGGVLDVPGALPPSKVISVLLVPQNCSQSVSNRVTLFLSRLMPSTLKMGPTNSFETSVCIKLTRCHILEDDILHSHRREHLKSCTMQHNFESKKQENEFPCSDVYIIWHLPDCTLAGHSYASLIM
jgi:hypothetical protein